jgi:hypothetical protein
MDEARRARAEARRGHIVILRTTLGEETPSREGTPEERVALAFALTRAAWAMSGQPWPEPGASRRVVRFVPRGST